MDQRGRDPREGGISLIMVT